MSGRSSAPPVGEIPTVSLSIVTKWESIHKCAVLASTCVFLFFIIIFYWYSYYLIIIYLLYYGIIIIVLYYIFLYIIFLLLLSNFSVTVKNLDS